MSGTDRQHPVGRTPPPAPSEQAVHDPSCFAGRRVLVTGGAGFVGSHLVDALVGAGARVVVLDDLSAGSPRNLRAHLAGAAPAVELRRGCVTDAAAVAGALRGVDAVFHLAAVVGVPLALRDPLRAMRVNLRGSEEVFRAAAARELPVLWTSSSEVYGDGPDAHSAFHEDDPLQVGPTTDPRGAYACSKAMAEWTARALGDGAGLRVTTLRLFNVVGPRQRARSGMVLPRFVDQAQRGVPLTVYGDGEQTRCFADVRDVVDAMLRIAACGPLASGATLNVGGDVELSIGALAGEVCRVLDVDGRVLRVPFARAVGARSRDRRRRRPDLGRLRALIGPLAVRPLADTIRAVAAARRPTPACGVGVAAPRVTPAPRRRP